MKRHLWSLIVDGDLRVVISILTAQQLSQRLVNRDEELAWLITGILTVPAESWLKVI